MKFVKFLPAAAAALVLAACSTAGNMVSGAADAVGSAASTVGNGVASAASATTDAVKGAATATTDAVKGAATKTTDAVKGTVDSMKSAKPEFETAAYFCDVEGKKNQVVSVTYTFVNGQPDSATVRIKHKGKIAGQDMKFDPSYKDGVRFLEGKKVWSVDSGFAQNTVSKTAAVMFTDNNKILAKNCQIAK